MYSCNHDLGLCCTALFLPCLGSEMLVMLSLIDHMLLILGDLDAKVLFLLSEHNLSKCTYCLSFSIMY
uniref:Uncharacterized protein n=1 Tax=Rhizophora mucronata TaxID=61149 RepID=A0A2P2QF59_RHIMU